MLSNRKQEIRRALNEKNRTVVDPTKNNALQLEGKENFEAVFELLILYVRFVIINLLSDLQLPKIKRTFTFRQKSLNIQGGPTGFG